MNISIQPAESSDNEAIIHLHSIAFTDDPVWNTMVPAEITAEQQQELNEYNLLRHIQRANQPNRNYYKAIDESTGQIVGVSGWWKGLEEDSSQMPEPPKWLNKEGREEIGKIFKTAKEKFIAGRNDVWCKSFFAQNL